MDQLSNRQHITLARVKPIPCWGRQEVINRPAQHGVGIALKRRLHFGHRAHTRLDVADLARDTFGCAYFTNATIIGQIHNRVTKARQQRSMQLQNGPSFDEKHVARSMQAADGIEIDRITRHKSRNLNHQVGAGRTGQQILQERLTGDI
jgi:hypothetical protein